jgi:hypothetical protein
MRSNVKQSMRRIWIMSIWNPVKHGHVAGASEWPFGDCVKAPSIRSTGGSIQSRPYPDFLSRSFGANETIASKSSLFAEPLEQPHIEEYLSFVRFARVLRQSIRVPTARAVR